MKPKLSQQEKNVKLVGPALAAALPETDKWWYQQSHLLRLNLLLVIPLISSSVTGYDGSLMNCLSSLPQWKEYFGYPEGAKIGLINACMMIGILVSVPTVPWVCDTLGRRLPIFVGCCGIVVGTIIQYFAVNVGMLCFARAFLGFFAGYVSTPSALLVAELAYPTHRGKYTSAYFTVYYIGAILASWVTFGTENRVGNMSWKIPTICQLILPATQALLIYLVPESPRWLVAKDRVSEATAILERYHDPTPNSQLVSYEMYEIVESIQMEAEASKTSWKSLIETPGNRKRVLIAVIVGIFAQWNGVGVLSYYLSQVLDSVGITVTFDQTLINGMLQVWNFFGALLGAILVDKLGRRTLFLWSTVGMLISYIVWTACSAVNSETNNSAAGIVVVVCVFIVYFHYNIAWTPLSYGYPTEIFPYFLRAKGLSVGAFFNFSGLTLSVFFNSMALSALSWKYYILFCCLLVLLLGLIYFIFPETKGCSLEEIAVIFDGPKAQTSLITEKKLQSGEAEHMESIV